MKRDVKSIEKIEFAFLRDLILSIKFEENIEATFKRINYAYYVELKSKNSIDPVCIAEDLINFLCKKIDDNKVQ